MVKPSGRLQAEACLDSNMPERRFPPPWTVEELNDVYFIVRDANGQQLAYVYLSRGEDQRPSCRGAMITPTLGSLASPILIF